MKRNLFGILSICLFSLVACHGNDSSKTKTETTDSSYAIIGKVTGLDTGIVILNHRQIEKSDTAMLDHGYFTFKGKADTAEMCTITLVNQAKRFFLENGKISILIKKDSLPFALISGTKVQDEYNYFHNQVSKAVTDRISQVDKAYDSANNKKNQRAMDSLDKMYNALDLEQKQLVMDFTKSHPASVVAAYEIYANFSYNARAGQLDSLYQGLDTTVRATYFGRLIQNTVEKAKLTAIGNPAPDFTNNDANGKPVSLSSFKGKLVLLDFWASWCGPCRAENPNLVNTFNKYHDKGFQILSVSLDRPGAKEKWLKAIHDDGLQWNHVSDLQFWDNAVAKQYGIEAIPQNLLLDPTGKIIAKNLEGEELGKKLAAIYSN
jgi:peroxiredoxin